MNRLNAFSKKHSKINYSVLLAIIFGGFLIFGLSENVKGPAIPIIQADFLLSESQIGFLLAINSLGYLIACTFTAALANKIGIKWTGVVAFAAMALSGICLYFSEKYFTLSSSYFLLYIGNGMLEIGLGIMAARIFTKNTGLMMNLAHFFYGLSSMVAPIIASWMMKWTISGEELSWRGMYFIVLLLAILPIIPSIFGKFPEEETSDDESVSYRFLLRDPVAWLIVMILSFGVVSELAVGGWLVNFLIKAYSWNVETASGMLSMFFLFFMLSRLVLGPLTDKIGYTLSIMIFAAFSGICSFAAIIIGEKGAILFAIAGIGIAPIYPTVMALLAKRYPKGTGTAITFTVTLMGIASVFGNLLIGVIIDGINRLFYTSNGVIGQQAGYGFIALLSLLCSICCIILYYYLRKRQEVI
ncbi:MFS transporter [Niallia sp. FSL W8-0177]|uniref:MFS transporter n=1 Tax=Niallia sp. FSL W8-0177 TaxID=2954522 RepID=UPI0030F888CE